MATLKQVAAAFDSLISSGRVGGWTLDGEPLGRGGFGVTFRAHKTDLDGTKSRAALKLLMPTGGYDVAGFSNEVRVLRTLRSPYLPRVMEGGREPTKVAGFSVLWFASELITGKTLFAEVLGDPQDPVEPLSELLWLETAHDILSALNTVHSAGLVHLDLKPDNVMLVARKAILIDFGLASMQGDISNGLSGAWGWFAPEQLDDKLERQDFEPPVDLFKAGLTLYFAATGKRAWRFDPNPKTTPASEQRRLLRTPPDLGELTSIQRRVIGRLLGFAPGSRGTAAEAVSAILDELPESSSRHTDESRARAVAKKQREVEAARRAVEAARAEERAKAEERLAAERARYESAARESAAREAAAGESVPVPPPAAAAVVELALTPSDPPASVPPLPVQSPTTQAVGGPTARRADRVWTIVLLVLGSLATLFVLTALIPYGASPISAVRTAGWVMVAIHVVLLAISYLFAIRFLRRGRLAFWIPLAAGGTAFLTFVVCISIIAGATPPQ